MSRPADTRREGAQGASATHDLYLVVGVAGAGKSTISRMVADHTGAVYLDKDTLARRFVETMLADHGMDPADRDNNAYYSTHVMPLEYDALLAVATDNLALGRSVVVDAPFVGYFDQADYITRNRAQRGWPDALRVHAVHVHLSEDALRTRLEQRGNARDAWKLAHWDEFWAHACDVRCVWAGTTHTRVDNTSPADLARLVAAVTQA